MTRRSFDWRELVVTGDFDAEECYFEPEEFYAIEDEKRGTATVRVTARLPDWLQEQLWEENGDDLSRAAFEAGPDE